jgi:hypothetical protein
VETHVNSFWRHLFCCLWQTNEYIKHTNTVSRFVAEDESPHWPAAIAYGRYYCSTLFNLWHLRPWAELHLCWVAGTPTVRWTLRHEDNILVLLFHPRIKLCLPFIYITHKFQLYMTWSSFMSAFLQHLCWASYPLKTNFLHDLFLQWKPTRCTISQIYLTKYSKCFGQWTCRKHLDYFVK